jgi:uncharacterized membrane protein YqjE
MSSSTKHNDDEERWRLAGFVLQRIAPQIFDALLTAAEVIVVELPESSAEISRTDFLT